MEGARAVAVCCAVADSVVQRRPIKVKLLRMWNIEPGADFPSYTTAAAWLDYVLPESEDQWEPQRKRAQQHLDDTTHCSATSCFAADAAGHPAGIAVTSITSGELYLALIAVRNNIRRQGLGRQLLRSVVSAARRTTQQQLLVPDVLDHNVAVGCLLNGAGFTRRFQDSIYMHRSLEIAWPVSQVPPGCAIRPLGNGEEQAWVDLKNACFPEDANPWTIKHFQREFVDSPIFDPSRILIIERKGQLVATTSVWEWDYGWGKVGILHWVGVHPAWRGRGYGHTLGLRALDDLQARGHCEAWLSTSRQRAAAVRLYKQLGFRLARERLTHSFSLLT